MEQQQIFLDYETVIEKLSIELEKAHLEEHEYRKAIKLLALQIKETQGQVQDYSELFKQMKAQRNDKAADEKRASKVHKKALELVQKQNKVQKLLEEVLGANHNIDLR